jgi:hypothetical protein
MTWTGIILIASNLTSFLLISIHNRVSSFYWIRESKHCCFTCFSYLNCYFLILVFLRNCHLLVSSQLSWLHRNLISCHVFSFLWHIRAPPCFWHRMGAFLEARCLREPVSRLTTGFDSYFCLLPKVSHANVHWVIVNHTFSSHTISSRCRFLACHKPPLSQCSTAHARNPQGISKLLNQC